MKYTDEDRERIIAEARATLERAADEPNIPSPPHEDAMERWARNMPKPEEPSRPRKLDTNPVPVNWVEQRIKQALAAERAFMIQVFGEYVAEVRNELIDEIERAYGKQFNIVRLDIDALRHELRKAFGAGVIELPNFLGERQRPN